jgi:hypothetical protein
MKFYKHIFASTFLTLIISIDSYAACSATKLYDSSGTYSGCKANIDGIESTHSAGALTDIGCHKFCEIVNKEGKDVKKYIDDQEAAINKLTD